MGGSGSGARGSKKPTTDGCLCLDTALLRRWQLLRCGTSRSGRFRWNNRTVVAYQLVTGHDSGTLHLRYLIGAPAVVREYPVRLEATPCPLGGQRWWFRCPMSRSGVACGARVRKLYYRGGWFGCRKCHGLVYRSSQESDNRVYALVRAGSVVLDDPETMSFSQIGIAAKAIYIQEMQSRRESHRKRSA
jgi:hypothetical protein